MSPENTEKLYQVFPRLYRGRDKPIEESSMSWGFCCGYGWFDLVWHLSAAIEQRAHKLGLAIGSVDWPEVAQVKEKTGSLRVYLKPPLQPYSDLVSEAIIISESICDQCGQINLSLPQTPKWFVAQDD